MPFTPAAHALQSKDVVDLALTAGALRRLPSNTLYPILDGAFRVVLNLESDYRIISVRQTAPRELTFIALDAPLDATAASHAERSLRTMLGLDIELAPAYAALDEEPALAGLARQLRGLRPPRFTSLWETLIQVIPFQQVSLAAAMSALNRLVVTLGERAQYGDETHYAIPSPERVQRASTDALRACGLSAAKVAALQGCARWITEGKVSDAEIERLDDEEGALRLRALPGIGPWSAQLTLLRGFGRLSNFPSGDSGAARGLRAVFAGSDDPDAAAEAALSRLGPWRGYLYFLLLGRRIQSLG